MKKNGFTLIEMAVVVFILGVTSLIVAPVLSELTTSQHNAYRAQQTLINRQIAAALVEWAELSSSTNGKLPAPTATDGGFFTPVDPANGSLRNHVKMNGVYQLEINDDNRAAQNLRMYQMVSDLVRQTEYGTQTGPNILLDYQYGVIYSTTCRKADTSCNNSTAGASGVMTSSNFFTWQPTAPDYGPAYISSLPVQMNRLAQQVKRTDRIEKALVRYYTMKQNESPTSTANFFPQPADTTVLASPVNGCWQYWAPVDQVLSVVGISATENGKTPWGGIISYCRDYDPSGTQGANTAPHFAALRFNKDLSKGINPDTVDFSKNVILTF